MPHAVDDIGESVTVHVAGKDLNASRAELPLRMPGPFLFAGVRGRFEPTLGCPGDPVRPSPFTSPEPTPYPAQGRLRKVVLLPGGPRAFTLELVPDELSDDVGKDLGFAVAGQVDENACLARPGLVDFMVGPELVLHARVLPPQPTFFPEVGDRDVIHLPVGVDHQRAACRSSCSRCLGA